jgi:hypothetical protein
VRSSLWCLWSRRLTVVLWLAAFFCELSAQTAAPDDSVQLAGSSRSRLEAWDWFETDQADGRYAFFGQLLRIGLQQQTSRLDWQVEAAIPLLLGLPDDAIAPPPQGQLGFGGSYRAANGNQDASIFLKQGFLRFKGFAGHANNSIRAGRFEFVEGTETVPRNSTLALLKRDRIAHRLIGNFGFTHVTRSFDGAQLVLLPARSNLTLMAGRATEGVFQLNGMGQVAADIGYAAFSHSRDTFDARLFALHYRDSRDVLKTDNRPLAIRQADFADIRLNTFGGHWLQLFPAAPGQFDLLLWGAWQTGDWGRDTHSAGAFAAEGGYGWTGGLRPWLRTGYFRSTGDSNPLDGEHRTFFQVLPTPRIYARFPFFNLMNNEDAFVQFWLRPGNRVTIRADAHVLRLSNRNDLWYVGGGPFQDETFGYVGRPAAGVNRTLANLYDVSADFNLTATLSLGAYLGFADGRQTVASIYPQGSDGFLFFFELTRRFSVRLE